MNLNLTLIAPSTDCFSSGTVAGICVSATHTHAFHMKAMVSQWTTTLRVGPKTSNPTIRVKYTKEVKDTPNTWKKSNDRFVGQLTLRGWYAVDTYN